MSKLVHDPDLVPDSYVHFSYTKASYCLRDYSAGRYVPPFEIRGEDIGLVNKLKGKAVRVDGIIKRVSDWPYWYEKTVCFNQKAHLSPKPRSRLPSRGINMVMHAIGAHFEGIDTSYSIQEAVNNVSQGLLSIKDKSPEDGFNRYDTNAEINPFPQDFKSGEHWTAWMLQESRKNSFVQTNSEEHDFHALCHELNLRIPRGVNPFRTGKQESFEPDCFGYRCDGTPVIIEVKACNDVQHPVPATAQAFCGALAVHAKFDMIRAVASRGRGDRKAYEFSGHYEGPYISLFVMLDSFDITVQLDNLIRLLMQSFEPLKEVAYFDLKQRSVPVGGYAVELKKRYQRSDLITQ